MTEKQDRHRIIPVRFCETDLKKLRAEAADLRLSIATLVRMKISILLAEKKKLSEGQ